MSGGTVASPLRIARRTDERATASAWAIARLPWPWALSFRIAVRVASSSMLTLQIKAMQESLKVGLRARERLGYLEPFALEELWQQSLLQRAVRAPREATERTQILQKPLRR